MNKAKSPTPKPSIGVSLSKPASYVSLNHEQYLRASAHPIVRESLARYDRGDIDYINALERIAVYLIGGFHADQ